MIDIIAAIESIKKVDEALGVIGKFVANLKANPDLAALKLAESLDEIGKTWQVMDSAITQFLKLGIDNDALEKNSEVLLSIEGGGLLNQVKDGRGHCHIIRNIFHNYLDRWFTRVLKMEESESLRVVFSMLSEVDDDVFFYMEKVAEQLQTEATPVIDMVSAGQINEAKNRVLAFRKELQPLRLGMSETLQNLYKLKSDFIQISGVA
jgi:hypothetical protein